MGSPRRMSNRPIERIASSARVPATKSVVRRLTASPTRRHSEWPSASDSEPRCGTFGQNTQRPKSTSVAGRATSANVAATTMPTAQATPSPRVVGNTREREAEHPEHDRRGAGQHGVRGLPQRDAHRLEPVVDLAQLVAVARDQQECVVSPGSEDQHRQDAGRRLVPRDVEPGQDLGGQHRGGLVGDPDDEQRDHPQDRAAVGDHQQERDHRRRCGQQAEVGTVEHGRQVGLDRGGSGDLDPHSVRDRLRPAGRGDP